MGASLDFLQGGGDAGQGEVEGLAGGAEVHAHTAGAGAAVVGAGVELDFGVLDEPVLEDDFGGDGFCGVGAGEVGLIGLGLGADFFE